MSIKINNNPQGYYGKLTQAEAEKAVKTLSHKGLIAWIMCKAHYNGYLWKYPDIPPEGIKELSEAGYLARGDGIDADWTFYADGGISTRPLSPTGNTKQIARKPQQESRDYPSPHTDFDAPPTDEEFYNEDLPF